jgi:hypothetical protein
MDAIRWALRGPGIALVIAFLAGPTHRGNADCGLGACAAHCCFDETTLCRWHRTFHQPNYLWRPLTPYFMPRPADPCMYGGVGRSCYEDPSFAAAGCGILVEGECYVGYGDAAGQGGLTGYGEAPAVPMGLERLGQIPNDLGMAGGAAGAPVAPRSGR